RDDCTSRLGKEFGQLAELAIDCVRGQRGYRGISFRQGGIEHACEIGDLAQSDVSGIRLRRLLTVADRTQVRYQVPSVLGGESEVKHAIEVSHHLGIVRVSPIVKIRGIEIRVAKCRGLEDSTRADVMLLMIDKQTVRRMAACATERRVVSK